ncbi:hypothetical protein [uncultured Tistrella sp.]|uniref:hypothetical protein n=1 Tax=Tistrella mobilis TaxID=171437 RepID=UPI000C0A0B1B|nr:hypothetical protein [uncultured Tistrella sp.]MAM72245.1 hypothetical protein [Tistrella sp.]
MPDTQRAEIARAALPRAPEFDATLALLREGAGYISARADHLGTDVFRTRLALRPVICMRGAEAAEIFYGGDRFTRRGAMPASIRHLLQDDGSVQGLDGAAHRHRKAMFTGLMLEGSIRRLAGHFAAEWRSAVPGWQTAGRVVLVRALPQLLFRAAAVWAGVPVDDAEATRRADEMEAMIVNAGRLGPANWRARLRRHQTEAWARRVIRDLRAGAAAELSPAPPAAAIAAHRDEAGRLLPEAVAAVELINLLRPVVAVGHFILFAAQRGGPPALPRSGLAAAAPGSDRRSRPPAGLPGGGAGAGRSQAVPLTTPSCHWKGRPPCRLTSTVLPQPSPRR